MPNRLIDEQSPYLLQHAHNPVNWFPWGDEAFALARDNHKPVIVSIGYAACHWCHVMERESFEDPVTAAYMNEHFICIKVDREEHPDVDHLYMDAVQAISGSGGWPLNVFVTPEKLPFYGGTYYPPRPAYSRPSWMQLMERMVTVWTSQQDEVIAQSEQMVHYLKHASAMATKKDQTWNEAAARTAVKNLMAMADKEWGGFGNAPKFPGTMAISMLLEHDHFFGDEAARAQALRSLDAMMEGGIYDQLNGGFSRYSTDREWLAPHFEKMLYDNALLVLTLCDAYQLTGDDRYRKTIEETIAFADRELKDPSGLYYSALDADSEGIEGKFYTWNWEEWTEALGGNDDVAAAYFGIQKEGNWEHTNILHIHESAGEVAAQFSIAEGEVIERVNSAKKKLAARQQSRVRPATDDKSLLSWNALMNQALTRAGATLSEPKYLAEAQRHMEQLLTVFAFEDTLLHTWKARRARIPAKLDDYAYLIQSMLRLSAATGDNKWIAKAVFWLEYVMPHFSDPDHLFFYFTSDIQQDIPVRKVDVHDGATPSANAVMAGNLLQLGMITGQTEWLERGEHMLHAISDSVVRYPYSFGYWGIQLQRLLKGNKTAVIAGANYAEVLQEFGRRFAPQVITIAAMGETTGEMALLNGKETGVAIAIYMCTANECLAPQVSVEEALAQL